MPNPIDMKFRLASRSARIGWFYGINRLIADRLAPTRKRQGSAPQRSVPDRKELFGSLRELMIEDAADASCGINPGVELRPMQLGGHLSRLGAMLRDLPDTVERRTKGIFDTAKAHADQADHFPDYYIQDFHFQTGGHLTDGSARLYDVQVETLFYGTGDLMRRAAFRPIHAYVQGQDQRQLSLLDVACGTGRFLRDVRRAYPRMTLGGLDLSRAYLDEARLHVGDLRTIDWLVANGEQMPVSGSSRDIVTSIFLFHELPAEARRNVAAEVSRVLKPGGLFVLVDSLQFGDKPEWDGLLEAFPERFHEPYYRHYLIDDLRELFEETGLCAVETRCAFMSKVMVFKK